MSKKQFSRRLNKELIEALKSYAETERKTDTEVVEESLREYLRGMGYWPPKK